MYVWCAAGANIPWKTLFKHRTLETKILKLITLAHWATVTPIRKTKNIFRHQGCLYLSITVGVLLQKWNVKRYRNLWIYLVRLFELSGAIEKVKYLQNMDANSTYHGLRNTHSCNLLKMTSTLSIALFARKRRNANIKLWEM